jgi:hypothetical protein
MQGVDQIVSDLINRTSALRRHSNASGLRTFAGLLVWPVRFHKAADDAPSKSSLPRAAFVVGVRFGVVFRDRAFGALRNDPASPARSMLAAGHSIPRQARSDASLEVSFPSALADHAVWFRATGLGTIPLRRFPCVHAVFTERRMIAMALRPAAWPRNAWGWIRASFAALRESCIAAFLNRRCSATRELGRVTWSVSVAESSQPALEFPVVRCLATAKHLLQADVSAWSREHPVRSTPKSKLRPTIRPGAGSAT